MNQRNNLKSEYLLNEDFKDEQVDKLIKSIRAYPIYLEWRNVTLNIYNDINRFSFFDFKLRNIPKDKLINVLDNVSGYAKPGEILAVLGPSGAGKTSLLNVLTGKLWLRSNDHISGQVLVNGAVRDRTWLRRIGIVEENTGLLPYLSVEETLSFMADMKLPNTFTTGEKKAIIDYVIRHLGLEKIRHTLIGGRWVRGVSSGELKLIAIATELLRFPSVLILDEPTSDLDSSKALALIQFLKHIACKFKITVILTIHQPRLGILNLFNRVIFMTRGCTVFQGKFDSCLDYFKNESQLAFCEDENPADYVLDAITVVPQDTKSEERVNHLIRSWKRLSTSFQDSELTNLFFGLQNSLILERPNTIFQEFVILLRRYCILFRRDTFTMLANIGQAVFLSLLLSFVYFQLDDDYAGVLDRLALLYFISISLITTIGMPLWSVFAMERFTLLKERSKGAYRVFPCFMAKFVCLLPFSMLLMLIFAVPIYFIAGLSLPFNIFLAFMAQISALRFAAVCFGLMIAALSPTVEFSLIIGPLLIVFISIFGGVLADENQINWVLLWIRYISILYYSYQALAQNELDGNFYGSRDNKEIQVPGSFYLNKLNLDDINQWYCLIAVLGFAVIFFIIGFFGLKRTTKPHIVLI